MMNEEEYKECERWSLYVLVAFLAVVFAVCLVSCRQVRYVPVETVRSDSVVIRDTVIQVELVPYRDSVSVKDTMSFLCNPYSYSRAWFSGGMLHHVLGIYPNSTAMVKVPYFIDRYVRIKVPQIVEVEKKLTKMQCLYMDIGKITLFGMIPFGMIIVGWLVYKRMKR